VNTDGQLPPRTPSPTPQGGGGAAGRGGWAQWRRGLVDGSRQGRVGLASRRRWSSRLLHRLGELTSHSWAGLVVAAAVIGWLGVGAVVGFPGWWVAVLEITSSAVTLVMVFAIQHTQARQESATQRKLDELLRALPTADNRLIAVEQGPDTELEALIDRDLTDRDRALRRGTG